MSEPLPAHAEPTERAFGNGAAVPLASVPVLPMARLPSVATMARAQGRSLFALCALPADAAERLGERLLLVLGDPRSGLLSATFFALDARAWPSLTPAWPAAHLFERAIWEETGLVPLGHPWLKAVRNHDELEAGSWKLEGKAHTSVGGEQRGPAHPFLIAHGEGVHEVAVGPIHAGLIEPGHFRFQCQGEQILHLEIQLGYQQRGAERLLVQGTPARRLAVAESIAGDTAVGHALAYCTALEGLSGTRAPLRAQAIRAVALELERIANHVGDLGGLCNDVGYLPGAAYFGRMRGDFLNLLAELTGSRFGRGLVVPGGVRFDVTPELQARILAALDAEEPQLEHAAAMVFEAPSVLSRFEGTGAVEHAAAVDLGFVGPTARACAVKRDIRTDHPLGAYQFALVPVALDEGGDVMGRATIRWLEITRSLRFVREQLRQLPAGAPRRPLPPGRPAMLTVALVEGFRGAIAHVVTTDAAGAVARHRVVDPSFHNWLAVALSVRGAQISDFPLCNKSFNLSYAGHDL